MFISANTRRPARARRVFKLAEYFEMVLISRNIIKCVEDRFPRSGHICLCTMHVMMGGILFYTGQLRTCNNSNIVFVIFAKKYSCIIHPPILSIMIPQYITA